MTQLEILIAFHTHGYSVVLPRKLRPNIPIRVRYTLG